MALNAAQIVLIVLISIFGALSIGFMIAFIVEVFKSRETETEEVSNDEIPSVFQININNNVAPEKESVSDMLAELDKLSDEEKTEEVVEEAPAEDVAEAEILSIEEIANEEPVEEVVEEAPVEEPVTEEVVEETPAEEPVVEEAAEEPKAEPEPQEPIILGSLEDYEDRLAKVVANRDKIKKELDKLQKSILKYDRTIRRKERNQKMLDRRAGELTNLNLLMYSVTDIKNVDEDKKAKQEELTTHIAELKASIQDAEEYIESNKGKNAHDVSVSKYLNQEKNRYNEEIAELEKLIKAIKETQE